MSARVVWKGLAVVDPEGRVVTWRGSETPKLYHSEEQGSNARTDGCTLEPVTLVLGSSPAVVEHTCHTAVVDVTTTPDPKKRRAFPPRSCAHCAQRFSPKGPNAKYCPECD